MKYYYFIFILCIISAIDERKASSNSLQTEGGCNCIYYNCICCQHIELDFLSLNGSLCLNASYLDHDYGFSVTLTYNNFTIINETVSARNPPPICIGENIIENLKVDICLQIYDVQIDPEIHLCFKIFAKVFRNKLFPLNLGCVNFNNNVSIKKIIFDIAEVSNHLDKMKSVEQSPSVILV